MRSRSLETKFLTFTLIAIASASGGILSACTASNQAQNSSMGDAGAMSGMNHGGMNHSTSMDLGPADADYDLRFIDAMTPHHQGAVEMAQEALDKSQRPEIKTLAEDIIAAQNQEISQLKQWRQAWYPKVSATPMAYDTQMGHMMPMSAEQMQGMMMKGDLGVADGEFDLRFINAMLPHHEGAVKMAEDAVSKSKRSEIKQLAQAIITSQQQEIDQMKQWRQAWYKQ